MLRKEYPIYAGSCRDSGVLGSNGNVASGLFLVSRIIKNRQVATQPNQKR